MNINKKTQFQTIKNEHYQALLIHLDSGLQNWENFSRLDRLEHSYKSLELSRNYICSVRGVDPTKISTALEVMPYMGYTHAVQTADKQTLVTTTLSVPQVISAFKVSPLSIIKASLHESTHACDEFTLDENHFENAPHLQFKPGDEILPTQYYHEISQNYNSFGIAWKGNPAEIRANEAGNSVTLELLKDLIALHPNDLTYQLSANLFENNATKQMAEQYKAAAELEDWKAELYQKYLPEGQTSYPVVDAPLELQGFTAPTHNFVTINAIRTIADQNEQLFKTPGYVDTELQGLKSKQDLDAHPEIGKAFIETNNTCLNQIEQSIQPQTTLDFCCSAAEMSMN